METVYNNLNEAILFVNNNLIFNQSEKDRNKLCEILTNDLLYLDSINHINKKETIIAIQNILDQLDHLFDDKKTKIIILSNNGGDRNYLPSNRESNYALGV